MGNKVTVAAPKTKTERKIDEYIRIYKSTMYNYYGRIERVDFKGKDLYSKLEEVIKINCGILSKITDLNVIKFYILGCKDLMPDDVLYNLIKNMPVFDIATAHNFCQKTVNLNNKAVRHIIRNIRIDNFDEFTVYCFERENHKKCPGFKDKIFELNKEAVIKVVNSFLKGHNSRYGRKLSYRQTKKIDFVWRFGYYMNILKTVTKDFTVKEWTKCVEKTKYAKNINFIRFMCGNQFKYNDITFELTYIDEEQKYLRIIKNKNSVVSHKTAIVSNMNTVVISSVKINKYENKYLYYQKNIDSSSDDDYGSMKINVHEMKFESNPTRIDSLSDDDGTIISSSSDNDSSLDDDASSSSSDNDSSLDDDASSSSSDNIAVLEDFNFIVGIYYKQYVGHDPLE